MGIEYVKKVSKFNLFIQALFKLETLEGVAIAFQECVSQRGVVDRSMDVFRLRLPFPNTHVQLDLLAQKRGYTNKYYTHKVYKGYYTNKRKFITTEEAKKLAKRSGLRIGSIR